MNTPDKQCSSERVELKGILLEFREALEEEIEEIKKSGQSSTLLYAGRQIESPGAEKWYHFNVEYMPALPADTPCKLTVGKDQFEVNVISTEENSIIISSKSPLPSTIGKARLENGPTAIMERLIKCIEVNAEKKNAAGNHMLPPEGGVYQYRKIFNYDDLTSHKKNTPCQNNAVFSAITNDITYIWGPPGTGKTTIIGQIIDELYKHNRSVLVVSHTKVAVDGAVKEADKTIKDHPNGDSNYPILRIGDPLKALPERVLMKSHIAELGKELYSKKDNLEKRQRELQQRINEISPLLSKIAWVNKSNMAAIQGIIQNVEDLDKQERHIQSEINRISDSMQKEKSSHPEYNRYLVLAKAYKSKKDEVDAICESVVKTERAINQLPMRIMISHDEIKKHEKYTQLQAMESEYMSEQFLRNELSKSRDQILLLEEEIMTLASRQTTAQQTILEYENKGSVAKFFAGKSNVTQAQSSLNATNTRLPQAKEDLKCQQKLVQEYNYQLERVLLLQEQIKAVIPSKTKSYWESVLVSQQEELASFQNSLPVLSGQRDTLLAELEGLDIQQKIAKEPFDVLSELGRQLRLSKEKLSNIKNDLASEHHNCAILLDMECALCSEFYEHTADTNQELFEELSHLLIAVNREIASINITDLQHEKEQAENELIEIFRQLNEIKQKMQELEKQAIMNAKVVGATLAKTYWSDTLRERTFDTVILDEASMASIPALWCASYLAESSIIIVGDFLQLPPIVMAEAPMAQKWLGKDIFYHSGMQERARDKNTCPDNFVMLNDQFRMESDIADIANMYYGEYGGLQSNDIAVDRVKDREEFYKWFPGKRTKQNIHLIDTESLHAWVTGVPQGKKHSRLNCFSAVVDVDLAFKLLENKLNVIDKASVKPAEKPSVLIVAPYKPHVERIKQLIKLEYENLGFNEDPNLINAGTIHGFQGSEADIVIFDVVIDEPHWKANLFMQDKDINDDLRKMFNVAITRAKFKLYVVGNFAYCQKRAKNNALAELLDKLINKEHFAKVDAREILPDLKFASQSDAVIKGNISGKIILCSETNFNDYFMSDIHSFKNRLVIYSPFMTENRLSVLLPAFVDAVSMGKKIVIVTKALSDRGKTELAQYRKCEKELCDIGANIIHKKGMHEKLIFVDSDAVWSGSLNALSFTGLTGEFMQRYSSKELTAEYGKHVDIDHICGATENSYEQKCPICGSEMIVKDGADGGVYWTCIEGDYSRNMEQQYPVDGILRCKCGAPYVFAMKNEPRWVCSENSSHFQKMRESDLKLEKMAALIPTKAARKEVNRYFAQKRKERESAKKGSAADKEKSTLKKTKGLAKNIPTEESAVEEQLSLF